MTIQVISNEPVFVTVYRRDRYYGGAEEGGWYGTDVLLETSVEVKSMRLAEQLKAHLENAANAKSELNKREWSELCVRELDAAEQRLIDPLSLPEPNLPSDYFVHIETEQGSQIRRGPRHYE